MTGKISGIALQALNKQAGESDLWDKPEQAQKILQERSMLENNQNAMLEIEQNFEDAVTLLELADEEDDSVSRTRRLRTAKIIAWAG